MKEIPNFLKRVEHIQNGTKNVGWGYCELTPKLEKKPTSKLDPVEQYVLVCGHNYHRKIKTLLVEFYEDGRIGLFSDVNARDEFDLLLFIGDEEEAIKKVINLLKIWFPEVRA